MLDEEAICVIHAIRPLSPTTRVTVHCLGEKAFFSILKRSNNSNLKYSKLMIFFYIVSVHTYDFSILYLVHPKMFLGIDGLDSFHLLFFNCRFDSGL